MKNKKYTVKIKTKKNGKTEKSDILFNSLIEALGHINKLDKDAEYIIFDSFERILKSRKKNDHGSYDHGNHNHNNNHHGNNHDDDDVDDDDDLYA